MTKVTLYQSVHISNIHPKSLPVDPNRISSRCFLLFLFSFLVKLLPFNTQRFPSDLFIRTQHSQS
jgi:hypothetical protein